MLIVEAKNFVQCVYFSIQIWAIAELKTYLFIIINCCNEYLVTSNTILSITIFYSYWINSVGNYGNWFNLFISHLKIVHKTFNEENNYFSNLLSPLIFRHKVRHSWLTFNGHFEFFYQHDIFWRSKYYYRECNTKRYLHIIMNYYIYLYNYKKSPSNSHFVFFVRCILYYISI